MLFVFEKKQQKKSQNTVYQKHNRENRYPKG